MGKGRKNRQLFLRAMSYMRGQGLSPAGGWKTIAPVLEDLANIPPPEPNTLKSSVKARCIVAMEVLDGKDIKRIWVGKKREPYKSSKAFLESYEWRRLRMEVLKKYGAKCMCCGRSSKEGIIINVDHIKSRRAHPELALVFDNLQVLCHECNHGKGNWDETDWR